MADSEEKLEITNALLVKPSRKQVGETTAYIQYSCSYELQKKQGGTSSAGYGGHGVSLEREDQYEYGTPEIFWEIMGQKGEGAEGSIIIRRLTAGAGIAVSGKVTIKIKVTHRYWIQHVAYTVINGETIYFAEWGNEQTSTYTLTADKGATFPKPENISEDPWWNMIWTRPGYYFFEKYPSYEIKKGDYIHKKLTTSVMGAWDTLLDITGHWFNQNGQNATEDSTYTENCIISPGDIITEKWFNACITLLTRYEGFDPLDRAEAKATTGGPGVYEETSYITAARINLMLGANGEKGEVS